MGQKIHPLGFRIGVRERWRSRWNADKKEYPRLLKEDQMLRAYMKKNYFFAFAIVTINTKELMCREREIVKKHTDHTYIDTYPKGNSVKYDFSKIFPPVPCNPKANHFLNVSFCISSLLLLSVKIQLSTPKSTSRSIRQCSSTSTVIATPICPSSLGCRPRRSRIPIRCLASGCVR